MPNIDFRKLYDTVFPILYRVAYRVAGSVEAAEDLCQEAFYKLYEKKMSFPSMDDAKYWLIRVVKNASLNYAKRKERERLVYQKAFREDTRTTRTGEEELVRKETAEEVNAALAALPEKMRIVLILTENTELNYKEIGRILGISEGNVKIRVFRAREKLQSLLEKQGGVNDVSR
ncbi:MAG: RNA polymerase sigma factor [Spirochaetaceae bacterium]|jgi:RNA polymerase sigma-70 factor (ECF subfamily)|nr:RNA polymerase sigma factor [Spirochaetaceae bacterium]